VLEVDRVKVVDREDGLRDLAAEASRAERLAVDLEASGMFTYRARICTVQLAWQGGERVAVVDTLEVPPGAMARMLGVDGPVKIVHDVAFDARLLAEAGVELGNVHDTAVAARMLGRTATGLASLLASELGVQIPKGMQQDDWRVRPLDAKQLAYLAADVTHLEALEGALWGEVTRRGIEPEVLEETRHRLAGAVAAARKPPEGRPYLRIKGADKLPEPTRAVLRAIAEVREREALRRDVPPHKVASSEALVAVARARSSDPARIVRTRGIGASPANASFVAELARAVADAGDRLPDEERALFERPRMPASEARARREREARVMAWRRATAKERGVDEQVVLPGHCVKDAVEDAAGSLEELARVPGIGAFRVERDGEAIVRALRGDAEGA
jgi:ribonuclease D